MSTVELYGRPSLGARHRSTEFDKETKDPVISLLDEQKDVKAMGATMRLGAYPCHVHKETLTYQAYRKEVVSERHRHRYEFNNQYREPFEKHGMIFSGIYYPKGLVEIIELTNHPWFVACQFHPEFQSKPERAHPLFKNFIKAALSVSRKEISSDAELEQHEATRAD